MANDISALRHDPAAMALVVYANSADRRAISEQSPVHVYVASQRIEQGETFQEASGKIKVASIPRSAVAPAAPSSRRRWR